MKKLKDRSKATPEKAEKRAPIFKTDRQESAYLLEKLKELRRALADRQHIPVYLVFQDAVLVEIAMRKPRTMEEFGKIKGVGSNKLARYGAAFVQFIRELEGQKK